VLPGFFVLAVAAPCLARTWTRSYGAAGEDVARDIRPTPDGGAVVAGSTNSYGAGGTDAWVLRLDESGYFLWEKTLGGAGDDDAFHIRQTSDLAFLVAGSTAMAGDVGQPWLGRLSAAGALDWQKEFDGLADGRPVGLDETAGGGILFGWSVPGQGLWVLWLDGTGAILSQKEYTILEAETPAYLHATTDGGFLAVGMADETAGVGTFPWMLKADAAGSVEWMKRIVNFSPFKESAWRSIETTDSSFLVTGSVAEMESHVWAMKLTLAGDVRWQAYFSGNGDLAPHGLVEAANADYVLAGVTDPAGGNPADLWILRLTQFGDFRWQRTFLGPADEAAYAVGSLDGEGFLVAGTTQSWSAGGRDAWVLRTGDEGSIDPACAMEEETTRLVTVPTSILQNWPVSATDPSITARDGALAAADGEAEIQQQCTDTECAALFCDGATVDPDTVCSGTPQTFEAFHSGGEGPVTVGWDVDGDTTADEVGNPATLILPPGTTEVTARVLDLCLRPRPQGCTTPVPVSVDDGSPPPEVSDVRAGAPPLRVSLTPAAGLILENLPEASAYNVYADWIGSWYFPAPFKGSLCHFRSWTDNGDGTIRLNYDVPANSWIVVTASTPCNEGPAGPDSAGTERSTQGSWQLCGEAP
jgi:hypothetical protein